jgi:predicted Zn-dependent peptidase
LPSSSQVIYCGYEIAAGTRHELPGEEGLAHFCEHTTFKGTERRNALQILNALEGVGGELNAFTNKEDTVFYAAISKEHFNQAVDVLTDIVFHSQYPQQEIEKEVQVICVEIESYNDSPAELIYDEFENLLFKGHPLGHNILGTAEQLHSFRTDDALRFVKRNYLPDHAVFFAYGDIDFKRLVRLLEKQDFPKSMGGASDGQVHHAVLNKSCPPDSIREIGSHQAHVMLGTISYAYNDPRRIPLYLLNNILGGPSMNARLNLSLREHPYTRKRDAWKGPLLRLFMRLRFERISVQGRLGLSDAAATALACGGLTALGSALRARSGSVEVDVAPAFDGPRLELRGMARARIGQIIVAAAKAQFS